MLTRTHEAPITYEIDVIRQVLLLRKSGLCCPDKNNPAVELSRRGFFVIGPQKYRIGNLYFSSVGALQSYCDQERQRGLSSLKKEPRKAIQHTRESVKQQVWNSKRKSALA
jgi:hypothetical protein